MNGQQLQIPLDPQTKWIIKTVSISSDVNVFTYAATISLIISLVNVYKTTTIDAVGNATINASNQGTPGQMISILITNDATSNKVITFGNNFKSSGTLTGTTNKTAVVSFISDGINFYELSRVTGL